MNKQGGSGCCVIQRVKLSHHNPNDRSFWEIIHADDRGRFCMFLSQLVLAKSGFASLRCRIRTSFADYFLPVDMTLKYSSLGVVCSLWTLVH